MGSLFIPSEFQSVMREKKRELERELAEKEDIPVSEAYVAEWEAVVAMLQDEPRERIEEARATV